MMLSFGPVDLFVVKCGEEGREVGGGIVEHGGKVVVVGDVLIIGNMAVLICHHSWGGT